MLDADRLDAIRMTAESAAAIVPPGVGLGRVRGLRWSVPGFDRAVWRQMAELGWIGLRLPEHVGGVGMGMPESVALYEALGRGLVPEPLIAGSLAAELLAACGESTLLEGVLAGERLVALAWQSRADALDLDAEPGAERCFVPMAGAADFFLVPVRGADGIRMTLLGADEVEATTLHRQDGTMVATIRVPDGAGRVIAADIGDAIGRALDEAALGTAAFLLGVAEEAFALTLAYLRQRTQFGQTLASFQALQHRAADMKIQLTLARASVEGAAADLDGGVTPARRAEVVSRAKARAADTALLVGREAVQMHGAIGYADEADIGLYTRKAMVLANEFGSAMAHRSRFLRVAG
jgi:alkylation response protein AidB-like acyl-CoA dehydrogenase